jgi:hypothetical protein
MMSSVRIVKAFDSKEVAELWSSGNVLDTVGLSCEDDTPLLGERDLSAPM